ncbi:MAG: TlpA disulfide reductase family protein [Candidatus Egerieousia sp.]|nr:TlpA disulfide reductase family protein [Candidatus Egerieousia sp.]
MKGFSHFYCFVAVICSLLIFCSAANAQQQANSQAQQTKEQQQAKAQEQQAKGLLQQTKAQQQTKEQQQQDPDVQYGAQLLKAGSVAPEFMLKGPDGKELALSDFKGKYVVLDFWASWCGDCRRDIPNIKALYEKYSPKGVEFVGVSFDDNAERWQNAIKEFELKYHQVSELKKWKTTDIYAAYGIKWIPTIYIIGPDGKVKLATVLSERAEQFLHNLYYVK